MKLYLLLQKLSEFDNIQIIQYIHTKLILYDGVKIEVEREIFSSKENEMHNILQKNVIRMRIVDGKLVILIE